MEKISNRTIAMLLIATIAIYLGGTFISLNKLADSGYMATGFAGGANDTGEVKLNIQSQTDITWVIDSIEWGTGYVDSACNNCTMYVNGSTNLDATCDGTVNVCGYDTTCCKSFNWSNVSLMLRNQGNQPVSVAMNITQNHTDWFGANTPAGLDFKIVDTSVRDHTNADVADTTVACLGNSTDTDGWWSYESTSGGDMATAWNSLGPFTAGFDIDQKYICGDAAGKNFTFLNTANEANFDIRVIIPQSYTTSGEKTATIMVQGTS